MLNTLSFKRNLKTIIGNGRLLRSFSHDIIENGAIVYEDDTILDFGKTHVMRSKYPTSNYYNAENKLIMPGFINAHSHYYSPLFWQNSCHAIHQRKPSPKSSSVSGGVLIGLSNTKTATSQRCVSISKRSEPVARRFLITIHHLTASKEQQTNAAIQCHVRNNIAYEVTDRNGPEGSQLGIEENRRFIEKCLKKSPNPLLSASFGLHASLTCSDDTLRKSVEALKSVRGGPRKSWVSHPRGRMFGR